MRPPPAGTMPHTVRVSALQARTIISRSAGRSGGIGPSEVGCAAGAGAAAGAAVAALFGGGAGRVFVLVDGAVGVLGAVAVDGCAAGAAGGVAGDATGATGSAGAVAAGAAGAAGGSATLGAGAGVTALTAVRQPGESCAM